MTSVIITDELVKKLILLLETEADFKKEDISYEVQDDFQFLLISISVDDSLGVNRLPLFKRVARLLNQLVPSRSGDYSWMVNFKCDGKILDSYFGGDSNCPDAGL